MNDATYTSSLPIIIRLPEVMEAVGMSRPSIYRLMKLGEFPRQVKLGLSAVGWIQAEVAQWFADRIGVRDTLQHSHWQTA
jgi:prophage regulatory protein